jgi:hypothetical protein
MNLMMIFSTNLAAGHSGQNKTVNKSEMKLSKMARYSVSLAFLDVLLFPDLFQSAAHSVRHEDKW